MSSKEKIKLKDGIAIKLKIIQGITVQTYSKRA
jgi:hypothetical protein